MTTLEFILGLLDRCSPAFVAAEDLDGPHHQELQLWQRLGFLANTGEPHPTPSCPQCGEGTPYRFGASLLCGACHCSIDARHLLRWRFDQEALLAWLARGLRLAGDVRPIEESLWQLGSVRVGDLPTECFFVRGGPASERGRTRVLAYRNALVLKALPESGGVPGFRGPCLSLLDILHQGRRSLRVMPIAPLLRGRGAVRFDEDTGALFAGDRFLGEAPLGTKEYHLLARLWQERDRFVAYGDLKHFVLRQTGSRDATDEATFCHKLKGRMKGRGWVPAIDALIATTNKGDGYRLRGHLEEPS